MNLYDLSKLDGSLAPLVEIKYHNQNLKDNGKKTYLDKYSLLSNQAQNHINILSMYLWLAKALLF